MISSILLILKILVIISHSAFYTYYKLVCLNLLVNFFVVRIFFFFLNDRNMTWTAVTTSQQWPVSSPTSFKKKRADFLIILGPPVDGRTT